MVIDMLPSFLNSRFGTRHVQKVPPSNVDFSYAREEGVHTPPIYSLGRLSGGNTMYTWKVRVCQQLVVEVGVLILVLRCLFCEVILVSLDASSLHMPKESAPSNDTITTLLASQYDYTKARSCLCRWPSSPSLRPLLLLISPSPS
jgi:hypothetical protein